MRASFLLTAVVAILVGGTVTSGDDKRSSEIPEPNRFGVGEHRVPGEDKQLAEQKMILKLRVCEGDPLGSQEANTLRVRAEPTLTTVDHQAISFKAGGHFPLPRLDGGREVISYIFQGLEIQAKPARVKDGNLPLELTVSKTTVSDRTDKRVSFRTETTREMKTVKLGETVKIHVGTNNLEQKKQLWLELTALMAN
jgi:hypothetical protein